MRTRAQEQAALRQKAYRRLGVALVLLLILGLAGFRHSTRAMSLSKESLGGVPAYVGGPADRPAVIVLQEWWSPISLLSWNFLILVTAGTYIQRMILPVCVLSGVEMSAPYMDHDH